MWYEQSVVQYRVAETEKAMPQSLVALHSADITKQPLARYKLRKYVIDFIFQQLYGYKVVVSFFVKN
jgi:hypothetical protein